MIYLITPTTCDILHTLLNVTLVRWYGNNEMMSLSEIGAIKLSMGCQSNAIMAAMGPMLGMSGFVMLAYEVE